SRFGKGSPHSMAMLSTLGQTCREQGQFNEALSWDKRWMDACKSSSVSEPDVGVLMALAGDYYNLAKGKDAAAFRQAKQLYERALKLCQKNPAHYKGELAAANEFLGIICQYLGESDPPLWRQAEIYDRQALKLYRQLPNPNSYKIAIARITI